MSTITASDSSSAPDEVSYLNISKVVWIANPAPGLSTSHAEWDGQRLFTVYTTTGRSDITTSFKIESTSTKAEVLNNGNFVIYDENGVVTPATPVFESFSMPFDTLLPGQIFRPSEKSRMTSLPCKLRLLNLAESENCNFFDNAFFC